MTAAKSLKRRFWPRFGFVFLVVLGGFASYFLSQVVGGLLIGLQVPLFSDLDNFNSTVAFYLAINAVFVGSLAGVAYLFRARLKELGLGKVANWNYLILSPIIFIVATVAAAVVSGLIALLISGYDIGQAQELGLPEVNDNNLWLTGIFLVGIVPIVEEFIFRGYLFGLLRRYTPFWLSAVITSILFGAAHFQWNVAINVGILSLALCYMREKTGSIWSGVALHALKNFIAFLLLFVYNVV